MLPSDPPETLVRSAGERTGPGSIDDHRPGPARLDGGLISRLRLDADTGEERCGRPAAQSMGELSDGARLLTPKVSSIEQTPDPWAVSCSPRPDARGARLLQRYRSTQGENDEEQRGPLRPGTPEASYGLGGLLRPSAWSSSPISPQPNSRFMRSRRLRTKGICAPSPANGPRVGSMPC